MAIKIKLKGGKELQRKLSRLSSTAARKVVRPAARKAATPINKEMKRQVGTDDKALRRSIGVRAKTYRQSGAVSMIVGPRVHQAGFAGSDGEIVSTQEIVRRGTEREFGTLDNAPDPFVRPTASAVEGQVVSIMGKEIDRRLCKLARQS